MRGRLSRGSRVFARCLQQREEIIRPWGGPLAEFGRAVASGKEQRRANGRDPSFVHSAAVLRSGQIFLQGTISALTSHCCTLFTFTPCKKSPPGSHKFHLFDCSALGRQHDHAANLWQSTLHFHSESAASHSFPPPASQP